MFGWSDASREFWAICERWKMHSIVQTADLLGINYRTLWKLDLKHLDATLRLETVDRIYATFFFLSGYHFLPEERDRERQELQASRFRIVRRMGISPKVLRREGEYWWPNPFHQIGLVSPCFIGFVIRWISSLRICDPESTSNHL